jgi:hypothetical protein
MTLELTSEQVVALDMALKTRVRSIEGLLDRWENDNTNDTTTYLIEVYSKELSTVNELLETINIK